MAASISACHFDCIACFDELLKAAERPSCVPPSPNFAVAIQTELGRYRVWAGNVGAAHEGRTYRISLDYRLKDASFYRDRVLELLHDLCSTLRKVTAILTGEILPFEVQQSLSESESDPDNFSDGDGSSDEHSSSGSSDTGGSQTLGLRNIRALVASIDKKPRIALPNPLQREERPQRTPRPATEVRLSQDAVKDIVNSLYRIATVVRRPPPADRHTKSIDIDIHHFAEFDNCYVREKFPTADPEVLERLGKGITRRRQLLKYRDAHNLKINPPSKVATGPIQPATVNLDNLTSERPVLDPVVKKANEFLDTKSAGGGSFLNPSTKATTFFPPVPIVMEDIQSVAGTASSYQSSLSAHEFIRIPPKPKGLDGEELETFECPYCHVLCEIENWHMWKRHVIRDLEPYMCTFPRCSKPDKMYASRLEWNQHELQEHRIEWFCNFAGHESYRALEEFTAHMIDQHFSSVAIEQLPSLLHSFRRPLDERDTICPLCSKVPKVMESHLARHHTQLALFAIPRSHYRDDESENGSTASKRGAGRRSESQSSRRSQSRSTSSIDNPMAGIEGEVLEEIHTTIPDVIQDIIPDDDDFDWKLPPNPDGTEHWLQYRPTNGPQEERPNRYDSPIILIANETLDICYRLRAILEDVLESTEDTLGPDTYFATLRSDVTALIAVSDLIKIRYSGQSENSDIASFTTMEELETQLHACKMTVMQLETPIREIYEEKAPNLIPDVSEVDRVLRLNFARYSQFKDAVARLARSDQEIEIRQPMGVPPEFQNQYFSLPVTVSTNFTGRKDLLDYLQIHIDKWFMTSGTNRKQAENYLVVQGPMGSGKTEACCKFLQDNQEKFWGVFWINNSSLQTAQRSFINIAKRVGVQPTMEAARAWLSNLTRPWLLLIDQSDDPKTFMQEYVSPGENGFIIWTTRLCIRNHDSYKLKNMKEAEAVNLLLSIVYYSYTWTPSAKSSASFIAYHLNYVPLALVTAGKTIRTGTCSLDSFVTFHKAQLLHYEYVTPDFEPEYLALCSVYESLAAVETYQSKDAIQVLRIISLYNGVGIETLLSEDSLRLTEFSGTESESRQSRQLGNPLHSLYPPERCQSTPAAVLRNIEFLTPISERSLQIALLELRRLFFVTFDETSNIYAIVPLVRSCLYERDQHWSDSAYFWYNTGGYRRRPRANAMSRQVW